jgi:superoxide dismutase, Fe-Mn family
MFITQNQLIMNKREFLKTGLLMGAGAIVAPAVVRNNIFAAGMPEVAPAQNGEFTQLVLPYAYTALEPNIDAQTMEIHYSKHHAAYTKKFNDAVKEEKLTGMSAEDIFANVDKYSPAIRNNGGGYYNHNMFWMSLSPNGGGEPTGEMAKAITSDFGTYAAFRDAFTKAATGVFGSGWTWLIKQDGKLKIVTSPNQDNPLMNIAKDKGTPILCLDVWEHAYYLKYQNKRPDYINSFWNVVNWEFAASNLNEV